MSVYVKKSPWIIRYSGSSCKGCDMEALACFSPDYDIEKTGARRCNRPSEADVLLITGRVDNQDIEKVSLIYEQMIDPKFVITAGNCAGKSALDQIIPVDYRIKGCAVKPEDIIDGIVKTLIEDGGEDDE